MYVHTAMVPIGMITASCHRLAPATKNIVNAASVMTPVVPRSGSSATSAMTLPAMHRNGSVPPNRPPTLVPRRVSQWAR